ncbi:TauD/TfdA family dioxygenase [Amycolatopsis samaneae]|uniref:TauD/TfdA family dioxygenase n=1 Tax=Amycolatopsis samaneae TaxID=664691 RepID=A0ABW5GP95_9PSEU
MAYSRTWRPLEITAAGLDVEPAPGGLLRRLTTAPDLPARLAKEKAIIFRGFAMTRSALGPVAAALLPEGPLRLRSTEHHPRCTLLPVNEGDPLRQPAPRLLLAAEQAATHGGAIMLTDCAEWFRSLDPVVRRTFANGICYTENLHDGLGAGETWQERFGTTDRAHVESWLDEDEVSWCWTSDGLRISYLHPASMRHPLTGDEVWQVPSPCRLPATGEPAGLPAGLVAEDELPLSASHSDGSLIPAEVLAHIADQGALATTDLALRPGDLLLVDNILLAHGRRPFLGDRRIVLALTRRGRVSLPRHLFRKARACFRSSSNAPPPTRR